MSVEWRQGDESQVLLLVEAGAVAQVSQLQEAILRDYLAVTGTGAVWRAWSSWRGADGRTDPDAWGELILSRSDSGDVLDIDPERFWEQVHRWFRSRGVDYVS